MKMQNLISAMLVAAVALAAWVPAQAARFFRYVDANGQLVMSHTIPNERVPYGYEIVDETARVIQKVAPQLSEVEYQRKVAV